MNRRTLRSVAAIPLGWVVMLGGYIVMMIVIAVFYPEPFRPGIQPSTGWLLFTLLVFMIWAAVGGFVTAVIAQRREIVHAVGLVLFGLVVSVYFVARNMNLTHVPSWYIIAGQTLTTFSILLGGWLRMKQGVLADKMPESVVSTMGVLRLSIAIIVDRWRSLIAVVVACITFVVSLRVVVLVAGAIVLILRKLLGHDCDTLIIWPLAIASFVVSFILSRYVYRRIMRRDTSLMNGGE